MLMGSITALMLVGCDNSGNLGDKQKEEVKEIVRSVISDILEKEPERFVVAIDKAMQNQQREAARKIETAATEHQVQFWNMPLVIGNKNAKLKLAVFFDPLDPVSQKFKTDVMDPIVKERSDVGFFLIPVSIYGGSPEGSDAPAPSSVEAAQLLIAATWQDHSKALTFWSKMPSINKEFSQTKMKQIAESVGLKVDQLIRDGKSDAAHQGLVSNGQLAVEIGIPLQLPVIFIRNNDGTLNMLPPFVKSKMILVLDDVLNGKPWDTSLAARPEPANSAPNKDEAAKPAENNAPASNPAAPK